MKKLKNFLIKTVAVANAVGFFVGACIIEATASVLGGVVMCISGAVLVLFAYANNF
jgi:hypothetical protein